jgi:hypothetical protein
MKMKHLFMIVMGGVSLVLAMLSADNRSMNICVIPLPEGWLKR